ncbi:RDD family protein [Paenibacillus thermotolerans]|uniref:RDD family protein n=1 Tax=Paenibacillus thermotolerans TaxID=3027807 RepID=UPI002367C428|nr:MULTISPECIES: RDD family protein [unclassified Paenibacillus]
MRLSITRLMAYWVDFALAAFVLVGAQLLTYYATGGYPFDTFANGYEIERWVLLTMSLPVWVYFIAAEYFFSATIGKTIFKLAVFDANGGKPRLLQVIGRTFVKLLPWEMTHWIVLAPEPWWSIQQPENMNLIWIPNAMMLVYIVSLFLAGGKRALHDFIARTAAGQNDKNCKAAKTEASA